MPVHKKMHRQKNTIMEKIETSHFEKTNFKKFILKKNKFKNQILKKMKIQLKKNALKKNWSELDPKNILYSWPQFFFGKIHFETIPF